MPSVPPVHCSECQAVCDEGGVCPLCREALPSGTQLHQGGLRIERVLGRGGFACTYVATDTLLDRRVAVKEFFPTDCHRVHGHIEGPADFPSARSRFLDEARLLVRFRHDNIVAVHSLFEDNNTAYMVMEYLEGESLNRRLQRGGPMSIDQAARVARDIGRALSVLHEAGLLHRDVKPDNIVETRDGRLVLIDFGTARPYRGHDKVTTMLTPAYAPIEQYSEQGQRGPASDIYALGATLYELVCGEPPPPARERLAGRSMRSLHDRLPAVPEGFSQAVSTALELSAEARWQSVGAFLEALAATSALAPDGPLAAVCTARLCGHRGIVRSVALSPGGVLAASAAEDKTVRLWDGGTSVGVLEGHSGWVTAVEFTPDGHQVVSGSHDRSIRTWDVATGGMVSKVETPDGVISLALSWDGQWMAAGLQNRRVLLWRDGQRAAESQSHAATIVAVAFAADSTWLGVAVSGEAAVRVLDLKGVEQARLQQAGGSVRALAAAPHRGLLAAGLADGALLVWDVPQRTVTRILGAGRREVVGMVWSRDGQWLVVARKRQVVDVFEVGSGRLLLTFEAHNRELTAVAAVGRVLLTASADESAMRWEVART